MRNLIKEKVIKYYQDQRGKYWNLILDNPICTQKSETGVDKYYEYKKVLNHYLMSEIMTDTVNKVIESTYDWTDKTYEQSREYFEPVILTVVTSQDDDIVKLTQCRDEEKKKMDSLEMDKDKNVETFWDYNMSQKTVEYYDKLIVQFKKMTGHDNKTTKGLVSKDKLKDNENEKN